MLAFFI